jgi:hypothetical protein
LRFIQERLEFRYHVLDRRPQRGACRIDDHPIPFSRCLKYGKYRRALIPVARLNRSLHVLDEATALAQSFNSSQTTVSERTGCERTHHESDH